MEVLVKEKGFGGPFRWAVLALNRRQDDPLLVEITPETHT